MKKLITLVALASLIGNMLYGMEAELASDSSRLPREKGSDYELIRSIQVESIIDSVEVSPNRKTVLVIACGGRASLWDIEKGEKIHQFKNSWGLITSGALSPDDRTGLVGLKDGITILWDKATGELIKQFKGHQAEVCLVVFSPDSKTFITGSVDRTTRLWEVETGKELQQFTGHTGHITSVAFSPDGKTILTGSWDKTARLFDKETGQELQSFIGHTSFIFSVAFSPDGKTVLTGSWDGTARLWDTPTGGEKDVLIGPWDGISMQWSSATGKKTKYVKEDPEAVNFVAFSPNGKTIITASDNKIIRLWDTETGRKLKQLTSPVVTSIKSLHFNFKDNLTALGFKDDTIFLWSGDGELPTTSHNPSKEEAHPSLFSSFLDAEVNLNGTSQANECPLQ